VRLGHISNLSLAKGLGRVIDTFRLLREKDVDVRLTLAGRCETWREREMVARAAREFGDRFEHLGPVYDDDKWAFFRDIDVMLFPTAYHNEAQPVVVIESMGCGVPVVTFDRACIGEMIGPDGEGGVCIDMDDDYPVRAAAIVTGWASDRDALQRAQDRAAARGREFQEMTEQRMAALVEWLSGRP
jgi:glycosyltransferase involved in cell wall biosynthesis